MHFLLQPRVQYVPLTILVSLIVEQKDAKIQKTKLLIIYFHLFYYSSFSLSVSLVQIVFSTVSFFSYI
jgi:hypothetical protein